MKRRNWARVNGLFFVKDDQAQVVFERKLVLLVDLERETMSLLHFGPLQLEVFRPPARGRDDPIHWPASLHHSADIHKETRNRGRFRHRAFRAFTPTTSPSRPESTPSGGCASRTHPISFDLRPRFALYIPKAGAGPNAYFLAFASSSGSHCWI